MPRKQKRIKVNAEPEDAIIDKIPDDPTSEKKEEEVGDNSSTHKPTRVKTSSFHITVNTNQRYGSKDAIIADMRPLYDALKGPVFGSLEGIKHITEILVGTDTFEDTIGNTETDIGIEYSSTAGLHAHALITYTHTTKLRIHLKNLRALLDKHLPHLQGDAPYVNVRFVPDQKGVVKNYVNKMVRGRSYRLREGTEFHEEPGCKCTCNIGDMTTFFSD
jgi:hypothetical protein